MHARVETALLIGNANVGKSAIFFGLTGQYVTVSNYPGTTIELARGRCALAGGESIELVDTPGTSSLSAASDDERATCELARAADPERAAAIVVVDALNLRRGLALALEVGALGGRVVLAVNMIDEARARAVAVDAARLSDLLGVPVVATVATFGEGLAELRAAIPRARRMGRLGQVEGTAPARFLDRADELRTEVVATGAAPAAGRGARLAERFGRAAIHPLLGWPIVAAVLYVSYLVVGKLGAGIVVDFLQNTVFGKATEGGVIGFLARGLADVGTTLEGWGAPQWVLATHGFLADLAFGQYGVVSMAITYALALILPIVGFFFIVFGLLEDTGYLPRLAVVMNRAFSAMGLNGKAVLPLVLGLGCDTMATLASRILPTRRERLIVAFLLALAVPCSAQLAVVFGLFAAAGGPKFLAAWMAVVTAILLVAGFVAGRVVPGEPSDFIVELPPIRRPILSNIARKTLARIEWYLREAVPLFVLGTLLLFVLDKAGLLASLVGLMEPLVTGILGLPRECAAAFVVGFLRRDYGAVFLFEGARTGALAPWQVLVATVTITLFLPCVASWFVLVKEFSLRTACAVAAIVVLLAFGAGAGVSLLVAP